ncbi:HEG-like 1 isoform X1 [Sigmodon hispidus]
MASLRAPRWPPPLLLLLLPLLLPPPATPRTRGPLPSPANRAILPAAGPPSLPGPGHTVPGPGVMTRRGRSGRVPRGVSAATTRSHWTESSNTEPHIENIPFYQSQEDHSGSRKGVTAQTAGMSHSSSEAPENSSFLPETSAEGRSKPSIGANITVLPDGRLHDVSTALATHSSSLFLENFPQSPNNPGSKGRITVSQTESGISPRYPERTREIPGEGTVHTQVVDTWVSSQASRPALEPKKPTLLFQKRNSSSQELSGLQFSWTQSGPLPSDHSSSSESIKNFNNSTALQSSSVTQTKSTHVTNTFTNGVPRTLRSLTVGVESMNETESFPELSRTAITSASVHSSPSVVDPRTNSRLTESLGAGEDIEPSTENGFGLSSIHWQSDSPTFGGHHPASSSEAGNESAMPLTEIAFRSVPSVGGGESTGQWLPTKSKTSMDPADSSALHPEAGSTWALTQFSHSAQQPQGGGSGVVGKSYSESSSTSSSESLDSSAPRGEHSTPEDGMLLSDSSYLAESTSGARIPQTSVMLTRSGERTLRSLSHSRAATHPVHPTLRGNVTEHAGLLSQAPTLGVTGFHYGQERGSNYEQRTSSSDHTDHSYIPSTFTKGERALLSITESSSSSDTSESSTSYSNTSDSPHLDFSSSQTQTKRNNTSSNEDRPAQSSTEPLLPHTSSFPSYTSTINMPNTLVLDVSTKSVEDPFEPKAPSPLPSGSQPHKFSPTFSSTGSPIQQLKSTSETTIPSSSPLSPFLVPLMVSTLAPHTVSQTTFPPSSSTLIPPHKAREPRVTSIQMSTVVSATAVFPNNQTADPENHSTPQQKKTITEATLPSLVSLPTDSIIAVTTSLPPAHPWSPALTRFSTEPTLLDTSTSLAQMSSASVSSIPQTTHSPVTSPSLTTLSSTEALTPGAIVVHTTPEKQHLSTNPEILVPPQASTEGAVTTEGNQVQMDSTTHSVPLTTTPTSAEVTTELGQAKEASPVSHFLRTSSPQTTDVATAEMLTSRHTTFSAQSTPQSPTVLSTPTPGKYILQTYTLTAQPCSA